jgi:hypothetical protein
VADAKEISLSFNYKNKEDEPKEEKGKIEKKTLKTILEKPASAKDLLNSQFILVLMKPTN